MEPEIIKGIAEEVKPLYHYLHAIPKSVAEKKKPLIFCENKWKLRLRDYGLR